MSDSVRVLEHIASLKGDADFSRMSLMRDLPGVSEGALSGFLSKAKANGAIALSRLEPAHNGRRKIEHYQVVDLSLITTRDGNKYRGGQVGRTTNGVSKRKRLSEILLSVAEEVEGMKCSLEDFSTKELMRELQRRVGDG